MQSQIIDKLISPAEILKAIYNACLESADATIVTITSEYFEISGDFHKFIFAENPKNGIEKRLLISNIQHDYCTLQSETIIRVPRKSAYTPVLEAIITVKEISPALYFAQPKAVAGMDLQMQYPCLAIPSILGGYMKGGGGLAQTHRMTVSFVLADRSDSGEWGAPTFGELNGYSPDNYEKYCSRPLAIFAEKIHQRLKQEFKISKSGVTVVARLNDPTGDFVFSYVRDFGRDDLYKNWGFDIETSGVGIELEILFENTLNNHGWTR